MHNKHVCPEYAGDCKDQFPVFSPVGINKKDLSGMIPVFSTIGRGPRGEGVTVKRMENGSYQFISTISGEVVSEVPVLEAGSFEVINNTPNPVGGEPVSVTIRQTLGGEVKDCNISIPSGENGASVHTCSALLNKNESNRYSLLRSTFTETPSVGDSVIFKTVDEEDEFLTFGEVYSVIAGTVGVNALSYLGVGWDSPNIGDNGNWWVGNSDTGIPATGPKGDSLPEGGEVGQVMTKTESGPMWADVPEPEWPIPVDKGGTGANTAAGAREALGITRENLGVTLENLGAADYIIAEGTTDIWEWRKWASGKAECCCRINFANLTCDKEWGGMYCTAVQYIGDYPFAFTKTPAIFANLMGGRDGITVLNGYGNTTQPSKVYLLRPDKITTAFDLACSFKAEGRWK